MRRSLTGVKKEKKLFGEALTNKKGKKRKEERGKKSISRSPFSREGKKIEKFMREE